VSGNICILCVLSDKTSVQWSCKFPGPMWVMVLNLMFYDVCRTSFLQWYVKCLEKGLNVLSGTQICDIWDHAKRHFFIVTVTANDRRHFVESQEAGATMSMKLTDMQQNIGDIYSFLWTYYTYTSLLNTIYQTIYKPESWNYRVSCPQTASLSTHGYECHIAMVTGKLLWSIHY